MGKLNDMLEAQQRYMLQRYWQANQFNKGIMPSKIKYEPTVKQEHCPATLQDMTEFSYDYKPKVSYRKRNKQTLVVGPEVREQWLARINQSAIRRARATSNEVSSQRSIHDIMPLSRAQRDLYDWLEVK